MKTSRTAGLHGFVSLAWLAMACSSEATGTTGEIQNGGAATGGTGGLSGSSGQSGVAGAGLASGASDSAGGDQGGAGSPGDEAGHAGSGASGATGGAAGTGGAGLSGASGQGGGAGGAGGGGTGGVVGVGGGPGGSGGKDVCGIPQCGPGSGGSGTVVGEDQDLDGSTFPEDCNDCDPMINPGALDILDADLDGNWLPADQQVDNDCDGSANQVEQPVCDGGLAVDDASPLAAARALGLCQVASGKRWGVLSAEYVQLDGSPLPATGAPVAPALGHGLLTSFGDAVAPMQGQTMLALSTGAARVPGQPDYAGQEGGDKSYGTSLPPGFPLTSLTCPTVTTALRDSIALRVRLRVPTNAVLLSFRHKFYTHAFPDQICSASSDAFITVVREQGGQFVAGADPATGNIAFDTQGNPFAVNGGKLDVCDPAMAVGNSLCESGAGELAGTGFEGHGATTWHQSSAFVDAGEELELLLGIADGGDGLRTSTVLLDAFRWSTTFNNVASDNTAKCESGGVGPASGLGKCQSCSRCLETNAPICCHDALKACQQDQGGSDAGCAGILGCVQGCAGDDDGCQQACVEARPAGQASYAGYHGCLRGYDADNHGACGLACTP